MGRFVD